MRWCVRGAIVVLAVVAAGSARAASYLPPHRQIFAGVGPGDPTFYDSQTEATPSVLDDYITWGGTYQWLLQRADHYHARASLSIVTQQGYNGPGVISTGQIMRGAGDSWLIGLGSALAQRGRPTYLRIMAEPNGYWSPYCAFGAFGSRRPDESTYDYRQAWRRIVLILRGGSVEQIGKRLRRLHMRPVGTRSARLPRAPVSFIWNPETSGDPNTPANSPAAYYPGDAWVDWVGTDVFSLFPNFAGLNRFYRQYHKPFAFGEWGEWLVDSPGFAKHFFRWVYTHPRVRMLVYYQSYQPNGRFSLARFTKSRAVIRTQLHTRRFVHVLPEWAP